MFDFELMVAVHYGIGPTAWLYLKSCRQKQQNYREIRKDLFLQNILDVALLSYVNNKARGLTILWKE